MRSFGFEVTDFGQAKRIFLACQAQELEHGDLPSNPNMSYTKCNLSGDRS